MHYAKNGEIQWYAGGDANSDTGTTFAHTDIIGVLFDLDNRQGTSPYLQNMVSRGELGMKTGQGFRSWTKEDSILTGQRVSKHLQKLSKILKN